MRTGARMHNLLTEDSALGKECLIQGSICFLLHQELQIIIMSENCHTHTHTQMCFIVNKLSENCQLHLMLLACINLQASEVWDVNSIFTGIYWEIFTLVFSSEGFF